MSYYKEYFYVDLKNFFYLEKNKFHKIKNRPVFNLHEELLKFLNTRHDNLSDYDDMDIQTDSILVNQFPNAILLGNKKDEKEGENNENDEGVKENITEPDNINIWDLVNNLEKESKPIASDTLLSETDDMEQNKICCGCGSKGTLIEDIQSSVIVCSECGVINDELIDRGPEWRQYNNDDGRGEGINRCGCPSNPFFPKSSQGTIIVGANNSRLKRKQKWNSTVYKERSLNNVFEYITTICNNNNIPKIITDSAKILYKRLSDCKHKTGTNKGKQIIIRGNNRSSIIAACVFKACEMNKHPRSVKEIAQFFALDEKKVTKGNKHFEKIMKNADDNFIIIDQIDPNTAEDYIKRHCPKLKISKPYAEMAVRIANNCCRMKLASDHGPLALAAASILVMANYYSLNIDKKVIARLIGTSDVTIGKIYNKIAPYCQALVDNEATDYLIKKFKING
ncbi:transcription initiation factor TFIIB [Acanthamoeba polyphaga moumouvirus]|uniref:Transcription initiation factor TFIIB n=3 Tax=Moumouvirus TaxID=3080801 RepID=L7RBF8_9VIRU